MTTPKNYNLLSPSGFLLNIEKLPEVTFFAQSIQLPSLNSGVAIQGTPMLQLQLPGDKVVYGDFIIDFLIDEQMSNYKKLFEWFQGLYHPESLDQYQSFHESEAKRLVGRYNSKNHSVMYSDGMLEILSNNNNPNNNRVSFTDMFPVSLSALPFKTDITDLSYLTARVVFKYQGFEFL